MLQSYGYGSNGYGADLPGTVTDLLSIAFVAGAFIALAYLSLKVRSAKSFQFEMFVFALVLGAAEVPMSLLDLTGTSLGVLETYGLGFHSVSMVILAAFVAYRIYGFFRGSTTAVK